MKGFFFWGGGPLKVSFSGIADGVVCPYLHMYHSAFEFCLFFFFEWGKVWRGWNMPIFRVRKSR